MATPESAANVLLIRLLRLDGRLDHMVAISKQFAQQHGIAGEEVDYEKAFVDDEWYHELAGMCGGCYVERWPELVDRARSLV